MKRFKVAMAAGVALLLSVSAQAELVSVAGGLGIYDTVNNATWTASGDIFRTQALAYSGGPAAYVAAVIAASGGVINDVPNYAAPTGTYVLSTTDFVDSSLISGHDGSMTWYGAMAMANYLNSINYAGSNEWALPQLGYWDGVVWPDKSKLLNINDACVLSAVLCTELPQYSYWTKGLSVCPGSAISFNIQSQGFPVWDKNQKYNTQGCCGSPQYLSLGGNAGALFVAPGDIGALSAVPVPGAVWLLGSGVMGLLGLRRRKAAAQSAA